MEVKGAQPSQPGTIIIEKTTKTTVVEKVEKETIVITTSEFDKFGRGGQIPDTLKSAIGATLTRKQQKDCEKLMRRFARAQSDATAEKTNSFVCKTCHSKVFYSNKRHIAMQDHRRICSNQ